MRRPQSGFTLIELLIVIGIIGVLAAALLPQLMGGQDAANALADQRNLSTQFEWMLTHKRKHNDSLPMEGGYRFVLATWTSGSCEHTQENFERFWTPGPAKSNDINYAEKFKLVQRGENPWPTLADTTTEDTHYVGRSKAHTKTREQSGEEAWMANDNENGWSLRDGTIHVLLASGSVRTYSYEMLKEQFGLGDFNKDAPVQTWGPNSPIVPCQKLDN